jgi:hypothetical protein
MKIHVVKKAVVNTKPQSFCDWLVDDPGPAPRK